jgi:PPM family protein phosphatase
MRVTRGVVPTQTRVGTTFGPAEGEPGYPREIESALGATTLYALPAPQAPHSRKFLSTDADSDSHDTVWARGEPRIAGATDTGSVRRVNQDAFGRFDDHDRREILLIVADGLGGHRGGEVASKMAVEIVGQRVRENGGDPQERLREAIAFANDEIHKAAQKDHTLGGMGTTIVCLLLVEDGPSFVAHVGDSRLYRLRSSAIIAITEDHSLVATLVREGVLSEKESRDDPRKNQILRALGVRTAVEIDTASIVLRPGDVFLLCSDGLHGLVTDEEIFNLARRPIRPAAVVQKLIDVANSAGGNDNITCVLAHVPKPMPLDSLRSVASRAFESTLGLLGRNDNGTSESEAPFPNAADQAPEDDV